VHTLTAVSHKNSVVPSYTCATAVIAVNNMCLLIGYGL